MKYVKRALLAANGLLALAIIILLLTVGLPGNFHTGTNWILAAAVAATVMLGLLNAVYIIATRNSLSGIGRVVGLWRASETSNSGGEVAPKDQTKTPNHTT